MIFAPVEIIVASKIAIIMIIYNSTKVLEENRGRVQVEYIEESLMKELFSKMCKESASAIGKPQGLMQHWGW